MDETPVTLTTRPDWWHGAACRGLGPTRFFPLAGDPSEATRNICRHCPVLTECAIDTLETERQLNRSDVLGFRAGMTRRERLRIIDLLPNDRRALTAECGTDSGYYRHIRKWKDTPCAACKWAHTEATAKRNTRDRMRYAAESTAHAEPKFIAVCATNRLRNAS